VEQVLLEQLASLELLVLQESLGLLAQPDCQV
jgi:hypothetical protein